MECNALDLHRKFIESQKQLIELANNLIEHANGNEALIKFANELIKSCEKSISIEQNKNNFIHCPECKSQFHFIDTDIIEGDYVVCPSCKKKICISKYVRLW